MNQPSAWMVWLYRGALVIYPLRLRFQYREQMLQTLEDAYRDRKVGVLRFWARMFSDLLESSVMQRLYLARNATFENPVIYHTLALAVILSLLGGGAAAVLDQMMRGPSNVNGDGGVFAGANQPQIEMVDSYSRQIAGGKDPATAIPSGDIDVATSLQPFVIFYDNQGRPVKGTGYLDQKLPAPPPGVFDFVRENGIEKVTWQPQPGVRLASVIRRIDGKTPGFVLAARSLRLVEEQKNVLWLVALGVWLTMMLLLIGGASLVRRAQRASQLET